MMLPELSYQPQSTECFDSEFEALLQTLRQQAGNSDAEDHWPAAQLDAMTTAGVGRWIIPPDYGGFDLSPGDMLYGYLRLAAACITTTFVLTQRNGACQRIANSESETSRSGLLPALGRGDIFATVGISHLTTSRQHLAKPAVRVRRDGVDFVLDGAVPWVTGARHANVIVTGGTLDDGRQVLLAVPADLPGLTVAEAPRLLAVDGSGTAAINLDNVRIPPDALLAGPIEKVMTRGSGGGAGSLTTSALALGAAGGTISRLAEEANRRTELIEHCAFLADEYGRLAADLFAAGTAVEPSTQPNHSSESIRQRTNSLALRSAQAYLAASKGAGFVVGHPAERLVRESMFFLVWSCPQPVLITTLRELTCPFVAEG